MSKQRPGSFFVIDFENTVPKFGVTDDPSVSNFDDDVERTSLGTFGETRVWAAAICPIVCHPTDDDVITVSSMDEWMEELDKLPSESILWTHNLAYDGCLIMSYLLRHGFSRWNPVAGLEGDLIPYSFTTMITGEGVWYEIELCTESGHRYTIRDSLKILPFTVDAIGRTLDLSHKKLCGTIDYTIPRPDGYVPTETELKYLRNDVLVMSEAMALLKSDPDIDLTDSLTIGGSCMRSFKRMFYNQHRRDFPPRTRMKTVYKTFFPDLEPDVEELVRSTYRGGFCYVNDMHPSANGHKIVDCRDSKKRGHVYDVNSLYPSVMMEHDFPVGEPIVCDDPTEILPDHIFFIRMNVDFEVKKNHIPFIQIKNSGRFMDNEYVRTSGGPVEITLAQPDYELFLEQYDILYMDVIKVINFKKYEPTTLGHVFDQYVTRWYEKKRNAKNRIERQIAKLLLNNLYGKMAQNSDHTEGVPLLDEKGILQFHVVEELQPSMGYIPIGSMITAYARGVIVRAAQQNYKNFLYADTDSLHMIGRARGIEVDPKKLGAFDLESEWDIARFLRQKTYVEHTIVAGGDPVDRVDIKAAGCTAAVKERLHYVVDIDKQMDLVDDVPMNPKRTDLDIIKRFDFGLTESGKLMRKRVQGGTILYNGKFTIHSTETDTSNDRFGEEFYVVR